MKSRFIAFILCVGVFSPSTATPRVPYNPDEVAYSGLYGISALTGLFAAKVLFPDDFFNKDEFSKEIGLKGGGAALVSVGAAWYAFKVGEQVVARYQRPEDWLLPKDIFETTEHDIKLKSYKFLNPGNLSYNKALIKNKRYLYEGANQITVCAKLFLPVVDEGQKVSAMMLVHPSNGLSDDLLIHAQWLAKQGIASFVIDHFGKTLGGARDIKSTGVDQFAVSLEEQLVDLFIARTYLLKMYPEIDSNKIGVAGMSRGAEIASMAQRTEVFEHLDGHKRPFDLAYGYYVPTFSQPFDLKNGVANKPYCAFVGLSDWYAPAEATINYVKRLQDAGHGSAEVKVYPGGFHGFDHPQYFRDKLPWYADLITPIFNTLYKNSTPIRDRVHDQLGQKFNKVCLPGDAYYLYDDDGFAPLSNFPDDEQGLNRQAYGAGDADHLGDFIRSESEYASVYAAYDLGVHLQVLKDTQSFLKKHGFLPTDTK